VLASAKDMKGDLERLISPRADFVPFVIALRSGESFPVNTVERLMLGTDSFCYRDHEGYFRVVPYRAIDQLITQATPEVH